jgi:hypothetical protein
MRTKTIYNAFGARVVYVIEASFLVLYYYILSVLRNVGAQSLVALWKRQVTTVSSLVNN